MTTPFAKRLPSLEGVKVCFGMPLREIAPETHFSVVRTIYALAEKKVRSHHVFLKGSSIVEVARTRVCEEFLKTDCTHLFWLDSDQRWEPEAFIRILALGVEEPIIGAVYPIKREPIQFFVNYEKPVVVKRRGLVRLLGCGLGFVCMQRKVIQELSDRAPKVIIADAKEPIPHLFRQSVRDGVFVGEDMNFFADARELGYELWVDPSVRVGHVGSKVYEGDFSEGF